MADENETTEQALAVMTKSFCEWCEWAAKVAGFETDDTAELREGIEEKIRRAKREGYMMAVKEMREWSGTPDDTFEDFAEDVEAKAPGEAE